MESALASIILITLLLFGVLTLSETYFSTQEILMVATQEMTARNQEQTQTALTLIAAATKNAGANVELTFRNTGSAKVADFEQWDVIVQYYTVQDNYLVKWISYAESANPGDNQWGVGGIYLTAETLTPEVYEPGILNPGEELVMRLKLFPIVGTKTTNLVTIAVANGVSQAAIFVR